MSNILAYAVLEKPHKNHKYYQNDEYYLSYLILFCMFSYIILVSFGYNEVPHIICSHIKARNHLNIQCFC